MAEESPQTKRTCFIISPIDKVGTEVRRRSDQMRKYVFEPVAQESAVMKSLEPTRSRNLE
jgi:hypothetical protein